jgi:ATP-dependent Clp endopeptidase proteolytic subunit ClpP
MKDSWWGHQYIFLKRYILSLDTAQRGIQMDYTREEKVLLQNRIISISTRESSNGIDGAVQRYVTAAFILLDLEDPEKPIDLHIDSIGGRLHAYVSIVDAISRTRAPINGIVTGYAGSSAFNILQFCDVRKAYRNADLMFHALNLNGVRDDDLNLEEILRRSKRLQRRLIALLARRSGQPLSELRKWSREQKNFTAKEALALGLIDEILPPLRKLPPRKTK